MNWSSRFAFLPARAGHHGGMVVLLRRNFPLLLTLFKKKGEPAVSAPFHSHSPLPAIPEQLFQWSSHVRKVGASCHCRGE